MRLPGEVSYKDENGHALFQCFLCQRIASIFEGDWSDGRWRVCHACELALVKAACEKKEAQS